MLLAAPATAQKRSARRQATLIEAVKKTVQEEIPAYFEIYKTLHSNPELSGSERETSQLMANQLQALGLEVTTNVGGYGVVALFRNGEGPTVMLRADMDAVPVKETTGLPYASTKTVLVDGVATPVMHACGHDMHSTVLLGTVAALVTHKAAWKGTLMAVCQPSEEMGTGAKGMLEDGLFARFPVPDIALALHVNPDSPSGTMAYHSGPAMAGCKDFKITFFGKGGHGAFPHKYVDPIIMTVGAILEFQTILSRNVPTTECAILTVGSIHGGSRPNFIPDEVDLQLTARFFDHAVGEQIEKRLRQICLATAQGFTAPQLPRVTRLAQLPPVINQPQLTREVVTSLKELLGENQVAEVGLKMISEDFALYGPEMARLHNSEEPAPTTLLWLGASIGPDVISGELHSSTFHPEFEKTFATGVASLTYAIICQYGK